jgi:hypothetical protein
LTFLWINNIKNADFALEAKMSHCTGKQNGNDFAVIRAAAAVRRSFFYTSYFYFGLPKPITYS